LAVALLLAALLPAATAAAAPTGPLSQTGRWIVDADGRVVTLHGVNLVSKLPPYLPSKSGFDAQDAAFLAENGLNTVRLGVIYKGVEPTPGVYDEHYLDGIAATVRTLQDAGIWVLLDFHQDLYNERFQGEGFPDWAVLDDGLPALPQLGFPGNYLGMPALNRAFDNFYANAPGPGGVGLIDRYAAAWRHVVERFKNAPNLLGYDLLNEPWPGQQYATCLPAGCPALDAKLTAFSQQVANRIREVDQRGIVFYEPYVFFNNGVVTNHGSVAGPAAMSFHVYCLQGAPADQQSSPTEDATCPPFEQLPFTNAQAQANAHADGLLLTEFGATQDLKEIERVVVDADNARVGWQYWHYCECDDPTTSGGGGTQSLVPDPSKPPIGSNVREDKLKVLARPYPVAVAGNPTGWTFDRLSGRFQVDFTNERVSGGSFGAGSATEIAVPAVQYPAGYDVTVTGAQPSTAPNADRLVVRSCQGRSQIRVVVSRGTGRITADCAAPALPQPRLAVTVSPRRAFAGRRTLFHVTVRALGSPVRAATVLLGGRRTLTNARGEARLRVRFSRPGRPVLRVRSGTLTARLRLTIVARRRARP
jgi:endoglycosylceramidase